MFGGMEQLIIKGLIKVIENYDSGDGVYVGEEPLSQQMEHLCRNQVNVRFFISDSDKSIDELKENHILSIHGCVDADYGDAYSDYTGYLWTNDSLEIGNHNLLEDISQHEGKFAYIEVDILS